MSIKHFYPLLAVASALTLAACAPASPDADAPAASGSDIGAAHEKDHGHASDNENATHVEADIETAKDTYPLTTCPITGAELGSMGEPVVERLEGREVRFCCPACPDKFTANLEENFAKMDTAIIESQSESYPLDYCLVSGDKLGGDHGEIIDVVVNNRLFKVCCKSCISDLEANKFATMLDDALAGKDVPRPEGSHSDDEHHNEHGEGDH